MENNQIACTDYDGMGNQGRFPVTSKKGKNRLEKFISKILDQSKVKIRNKYNDVRE